MNVSKLEHLNNRYTVLSAIGVFLFICVFFSYIHPLAIFDQDDWHYLANYHRPFPLWGSWNPGRVMPEIIMPIAGYIAAYFVTPFNGDYVNAVTLTSSIIMGAAVLGYYLVFNKLIGHIFRFKPVMTVLLSLFFLLAHFGLLRSQDTGNVYLLFGLDLTCYFFYVLPFLLNAGLVMFFMAVKDFPAYYGALSNSKKGLFIVLLYLAIFSNLFDSVILASFCMIQLCEGLYHKQKPYKFHLVILVLWILSMIFEVNGHNAAHMSKGPGHFQLPIGDTFAYFLGLARQIDWSYIALAIVCLTAAIILYRRTKLPTAIDRRYKQLMVYCVGALIGTMIFLVLLCAAAQPDYAGRIQSMAGVFFYGVLMLALCGAYILYKTSFGKTTLPFLLLLFFIMGTNGFSVFNESNTFNKPPQECMAVSRNLIQQARIAEASGQKEMTLRVPKGDDASNWPYPTQYFGNHFAHTLYSHNLVGHALKIKVQIDSEMNSQFYK